MSRKIAHGLALAAPAMLLLAACPTTQGGTSTGGVDLAAPREAGVRRSDLQVNLGRTSLARVDGVRPMDDPFYGVRNAFDDGGNWVGGIQYSYWLSSGEAQPWIDVRFDAPVSVAQVDVDLSPLTGCSVRLETEQGELELQAGAHAHVAAAADPGGGAALAGGAAAGGGVASLTLRDPVAGVRALRIRFPDAGGSGLRVYEVRVLGSAPRDAAREAILPRVVASERNALLAASDLFEAWKRSAFEGLTPRVEEEADAFVVTYSREGRPVCRVRMPKATGSAELEALVDLPWSE